MFVVIVTLSTITNIESVVHLIITRINVFCQFDMVFFHFIYHHTYSGVSILKSQIELFSKDNPI